jgi:hypothetical protein
MRSEKEGGTTSMWNVKFEALPTFVFVYRTYLISEGWLLCQPLHTLEKWLPRQRSISTLV